MTTLLIVQANPAALIAQGAPDFAAVFAALLARIAPGARLRHAAPFEAALTEADLAGVDGVVFTGSSTPFATDAAEARPQRAAMERVFAAGLPVWGSCNGMQLAATVLGGRVGASPNGREDGLAHAIRPTDTGRAHPMMAGRPAHGFAAPAVHRDEVQILPPGAVLLATNAHSPVQAFAVAADGVDFWGTQYHPELSAGFIADTLDGMGTGGAFARRLRAVETDPGVARALGTTCAEQALPARAQELVNWLAHVRHVAEPVAPPAAILPMQGDQGAVIA